MTYIVSLLILISSFIKRNNKYIFGILVVFMFVMFGWSNNTADWTIYLNRYYYYNILTENVEPIFYMIMKFFNSIKFDFRQFLISISFIIMMLYSYTINKKSKAKNFVLALYFIFPFIIEVSQIRFAMAAVFAIIGLLNLCEEKCSNKNYIIYISATLIASMIHYAFIFNFVFIFVKKIDINKLIIICLCVVILISLGIFAVNKVGKIQGESTLINKINFVLGLNYNNSIKSVANVLIRMILFFAFFTLMNRIVMKKLKKKNNNIKDIYFCELVFKFNIAVLILLPIVYYSPDIYRIQQSLSVLNYMTYALYFDGNNLINDSKIKVNELIFTILCIINAFTNLYFLVLNNSNINTVFYAFFNNNILIH